jgi:peptidoglycan/xylan/chitin deacetylase (PgdA/CDA1 family)
MTLSRHLLRPRSVLRAATPVAAALLLLVTGLPADPGVTVAAGPRHGGRTPHQEANPSPTPTGPAVPSVFRVATDQKVIALTFDDGWDAKHCLAIGSVLDRYAIPATFFPNGTYVRRSPAIWRSIGARFPIGNHTYGHPDLRKLSNAGIARELERNRKTIERITGKPMAPLLRPPYGAFDKRVAKVAGGLGYTHIVLWNLSDGDTGPRATARGSAIAALRGGPGSIVLMHCGPDITPVLLPSVIERYACRGFRFVTVEELLAGSAGHAARVDCPPLPLPPKTHSRRPASPPPSTGPGMSPVEPSTAPTPAPTLLGDVPFMLVTWVDRLGQELLRLVDSPGAPESPAPG